MDFIVPHDVPVLGKIIKTRFLFKSWGEKLQNLTFNHSIETPMNIAAALKSEISRVARKELRGESQSLKKSSAQYRSDIASLKKRVMELERLVKRLGKASTRSAPPAAPQSASKGRYSAKGMAAQRKRLGLSAADMGSLIGVSGQSIYHWEQGKSRPRASQMPAINAVRKMGKRDAAQQLSAPGA